MSSGTASSRDRKGVVEQPSRRPRRLHHANRRVRRAGHLDDPRGRARATDRGWEPVVVGQHNHLPVLGQRLSGPPEIHQSSTGPSPGSDRRKPGNRKGLSGEVARGMKIAKASACNSPWLITPKASLRSVDRGLQHDPPAGLLPLQSDAAQVDVALLPQRCPDLAGPLGQRSDPFVAQPTGVGLQPLQRFRRHRPAGRPPRRRPQPCAATPPTATPPDSTRPPAPGSEPRLPGPAPHRRPAAAATSHRRVGQCEIVANGQLSEVVVGGAGLLQRAQTQHPRAAGAPRSAPSHNGRSGLPGLGACGGQVTRGALGALQGCARGDAQFSSSVP